MFTPIWIRKVGVLNNEMKRCIHTSAELYRPPAMKGQPQTHVMFDDHDNKPHWPIYTFLMDQLHTIQWHSNAISSRDSLNWWYLANQTFQDWLTTICARSLSIIFKACLVGFLWLVLTLPPISLLRSEEKHTCRDPESIVCYTITVVRTIVDMIHLHLFLRLSICIRRL